MNETITLLKRYQDEAKILAGGMSLIPLMKLRLALPAYLIDINKIKELEYIKEKGKRLYIGALARHHTIERSEIVRRRIPLLAETAAWIGDPQVRNMGTIGGSLCHADPSGDWGASLLALRGEMSIKGPRRERFVTADKFFLDTFTSEVGPSELLTEVRVPTPPARSGHAYMKLERKAGDFATVGVAVQIALDPRGVCKYAGIGLTALGPTNLRAKSAESVLLGSELTGERIERAAIAASEDAQPVPDPLRGSAEYRKEMAKVFTRRGLELAVNRARGGRRMK